MHVYVLLLLRTPVQTYLEQTLKNTRFVRKAHFNMDLLKRKVGRSFDIQRLKQYDRDWIKCSSVPMSVVLFIPANSRWFHRAWIQWVWLQDITVSVTMWLFFLVFITDNVDMWPIKGIVLAVRQRLPNPLSRVISHQIFVLEWLFYQHIFSFLTKIPNILLTKAPENCVNMQYLHPFE